MIRVFLFDDLELRHKLLAEALAPRDGIPPAAEPAFRSFAEALDALARPERILSALEETVTVGSVVLIDMQFVCVRQNRETGRDEEQEIPATQAHWDALRARTPPADHARLDRMIAELDEEWPPVQRARTCCTLGAFLTVAAACLGLPERCRIITSAAPYGPLKLPQKWGIKTSTWSWSKAQQTAKELGSLVDGAVNSPDPRDGVLHRTRSWFSAASQSAESPVPHLWRAVNDVDYYGQCVRNVFPWLPVPWLRSPGLFASMKSLLGADCCRSVGATGKPLSIGGALFMYIWACETQVAGWMRAHEGEWREWPPGVENACLHPVQEPGLAARSALWLWQAIRELITCTGGAEGSRTTLYPGLPVVAREGTSFRAELPWPTESGPDFQLSRRVGALIRDVWARLVPEEVAGERDPTRVGNKAAPVALVLPGTARGTLLGHALDSMVGVGSVGAPGGLRVERNAPDAPAYLVVYGTNA